MTGDTGVPLPVALNLDEIVADGPGDTISHMTDVELEAFARPLVAEVRRLQAENERLNAAFHVPQIAERADRSWGVICAACSWKVGDYVHECAEGSEMPHGPLVPVAGFGGITPEQARQAIAAIARVEALAEKWRYKGEFGWGAWQEGHGPDEEGWILDRAAAEVRAALAAAVPEPQEAQPTNSNLKVRVVREKGWAVFDGSGTKILPSSGTRWFATRRHAAEALAVLVAAGHCAHCHRPLPHNEREQSVCTVDEIEQ